MAARDIFKFITCFLRYIRKGPFLISANEHIMSFRKRLDFPPCPLLSLGIKNIYFN